MMQLLILDAEEFYLEDECGEGRNVAVSTFAVCQFVGDAEFVNRSYGHHLQGFGPSLDDLCHSEGGRLVALVAGIEDRAVDETSLVVHLHLVGVDGQCAFTLLDDLVEESAFRTLYAVVLGICSEEVGIFLLYHHLAVFELLVGHLHSGVRGEGSLSKKTFFQTLHEDILLEEILDLFLNTILDIKIMNLLVEHLLKKDVDLL